VSVIRAAETVANPSRGQFVVVAGSGRRGSLATAAPRRGHRSTGRAASPSRATQASTDGANGLAFDRKEVRMIWRGTS
jgi:hypothetical protein